MINSSSNTDKTVAWFDDNAEAYIERTFDLPVMNDVYDRFLLYVPKPGKILDAGCGSGRDALAFYERGYEVEAYDASPKIAELASQKTGLAIKTMRFDEMVYQSEFEGIWVSTSLSHLTKKDFIETLPLFLRALKPDGYFYFCMKQGEGEGWEGDKYFANYSAEELETILKNFPEFKLIETFSNGSYCSDRAGFAWINMIVQKVIH